MSIAVIVTDRNTDVLCQQLRHLLPDVRIQQWPEITQPETVKLALLWQHPSGITDLFPDLEMVISIGAGMDHIDADQAISDTVKRERTVTDALKRNMAQYVLQHILNHHRHQNTYQQQQKRKHWQVLESSESVPTVGFLGLGQLGTFVADRCADLGFETMAWTVKQQHQAHACHHGHLGLKEVCQNSDFLVILLPLNDSTKAIIQNQTLSWCSGNTVLINVARGGHVNESDLLRGLDKGEIKHAVLDVFQHEPLPADHPFWMHPKITITPHSSSRSDAVQTAEQVVAHYRRL